LNAAAFQLVRKIVRVRKEGTATSSDVNSNVRQKWEKTEGTQEEKKGMLKKTKS